MTNCKECGHETTDPFTDEFTYNGVTWSTVLLYGGISKTQTDWNAGLEGTKWRLPTVKEYESLYGCPNEQFMTSIKKELISAWLMTSDIMKNPFTGEERPVVLGLVVDRFGINASVGSSSWPARGVKK